MLFFTAIPSGIDKGITPTTPLMEDDPGIHSAMLVVKPAWGSIKASGTSSHRLRHQNLVPFLLWTRRRRWTRVIGARAHNVHASAIFSRLAIHVSRIAALEYTATTIGDPHGVVGGEATVVRSVVAIVTGKFIAQRTGLLCCGTNQQQW